MFPFKVVYVRNSYKITYITAFPFKVLQNCVSRIFIAFSPILQCRPYKSFTFRIFVEFSLFLHCSHCNSYENCIFCAKTCLDTFKPFPTKYFLAFGCTYVPYFLDFCTNQNGCLKLFLQ